MSDQNSPLNNGQQAINNTDLSKIFIGNNRYENGLYTNSIYDPESLKAGMLMGRIASSQALVKCEATASDGSQFPVGILAHDIDVVEGTTVQISICIAGDVAEGKVIMHSGTTLDTVVSSRSFRDRIAADTVGIILRASTEMTDYDNS